MQRKIKPKQEYWLICALSGSIEQTNPLFFSCTFSYHSQKISYYPSQSYLPEIFDLEP